MRFGEVTPPRTTEEIQQVLDNVAKVVVGKNEAIFMCLVAVVAGGHVLLEDVPGVGKTLLVRALARTLNCHFNRIQFTPDLLPSDVTGTEIYNRETRQFEFRAGPIFAQIVLADEINRTSPRTQSALLEALEEHTVSCDGTTHELPSPFFVLATQNPIEYEGTYALPEAQLDRFLMKLSLGYPTPDKEQDVLRAALSDRGIETVHSVVNPQAVLAWQVAARQVRVEENLLQYIVEIITKTRQHPDVFLGVSPRGGVALAKAARALAWLEGRRYVIPDDIKRLLIPVLSHRLLLHSHAHLNRRDEKAIIEQIARETPVPVAMPRR
ncbi:AAA family ATPase [Sulfoacidibacillus thermotolerans]|uniref:AAA family ATPase n=1 Tax=Sulfoacidibacillus thermotolerans TaxID=1765684 RepID=A0A2U3D8Q6_SULT2|nr:MoxR family ATPase [Sulfoacidibacillus thermotolerans]PWI57670.1 AAA family ATPase [Sulfoacidibacillus thermotolerans]